MINGLLRLEAKIVTLLEACWAWLGSGNNGFDTPLSICSYNYQQFNIFVCSYVIQCVHMDKTFVSRGKKLKSKQTHCRLQSGGLFTPPPSPDQAEDGYYAVTCSGTSRCCKHSRHLHIIRKRVMGFSQNSKDKSFLIALRHIYVQVHTYAQSKIVY